MIPLSFQCQVPRVYSRAILLIAFVAHYDINLLPHPELLLFWQKVLHIFLKATWYIVFSAMYINVKTKFTPE